MASDDAKIRILVVDAQSTGNTDTAKGHRTRWKAPASVERVQAVLVVRSWKGFKGINCTRKARFLLLDYSLRLFGSSMAFAKLLAYQTLLSRCSLTQNSTFQRKIDWLNSYLSLPISYPMIRNPPFLPSTIFTMSHMQATFLFRAFFPPPTTCPFVFIG